MHAKEWYKSHQEEILKEFFAFLKFPSVSAQHKHKKDVLACADWVEAYLGKIGLKTGRITGEGNPIILGERKGSGKGPTLLFYGHYDVQPPEPFELWKSPPFEPVIRDGKVYARGAEDNKGQIFYTMTAIRAFLEKHAMPNVTIKVLVEGEEEIGSKFLGEEAHKHKEKLKADHILVVDMGMGSKKKPSLCIGARGIMTFEMTLRNMSTDVHSGTYGGIAYNPNRALAEILGAVHDKQGSVVIPGFYDGVVELSPSEKKEIDFSFDREHHKREIGLKAFHEVAGFEPLEMAWLRPVFEINGMWGGYTGEGFKTVLPKEAHAKISCRLVPGQNPKKIFQNIQAFFAKLLPKEMEVEYANYRGEAAIRSSPKEKCVTVVRKAYEEVFGSCGLILGGGSIPVSLALAEAAGASVVFPGTALDTDNIHAPNEHFGLDQFEMGFEMILKTLELFDKGN